MHLYIIIIEYIEYIYIDRVMVLYSIRLIRKSSRSMLI